MGVKIKKIKVFLVVAFFLLISIANAKAQCPEGMISYWKGEDNAVDTVDSNHGTIYGAAFTTGKIGRAFSFDGVDDYVDIKNGALIANKNNSSVEAWIKWDGTMGERAIYDESEAGGTVFRIRLVDGVAYFDLLNIGGWHSAGSSSSITQNEWHHIAGVLSSSTGMKVYVDGVEKGSNPNTLPSDHIILHSWIGRFGQEGHNFAGLIDEVAIYNRTLTAEEIEQHYQLGKTGKDYCNEIEIFNMHLNSGWNLISLPLEPLNKTMPEPFKSIEGKYKSIFAYNASSGEWLSYDPVRPDSQNTLKEVDERMGFWVNMLQGDDLGNIGVKLDLYFNLVNGWNLVGYPSLDEKNVDDALDGYGYSSVFMYNSTNRSWQSYDSSMSDFLNDLRVMSAGYGYWVNVDEESILREKTSDIGDMYDCPLNRNAYFIVGNIGYSFIDDEINYAFAKLLNEKNCQTQPRYVIFYVSSVNFPSNGTPAGSGADIEQGWLDYWDYNARRFAALGYDIMIHPMPFIVNEDIDNLDYPPGLRPLNKSDLNMDEEDIPVVYECRDGRQTKIASIYDPRTLNMGVEFYKGLKNFFSNYSSFTKISIVPPSDFGEYGFPFGVNARWWEGSDNVGDCYRTGDIYARALIPTDPPSYEQYNGKLNEFRANLTREVKNLFPDKDYALYFGYGNDDNPTDGFSYQESVSFLVNNGIDIHSAHGGGIDVMEVPLSKIVINKPEGYEFTLEDTGIINGYMALKRLYHAAKYDVKGLVLYVAFLFDDFYTYHLLYSMGNDSGLYTDKEISFNGRNNLGSLRSDHLVESYIDIPVNGTTVNGDINNLIGGWGYYEAPYGDKQNYGVLVYVGHLLENSPYPPDVGYSYYHPEFMRLVGSTTTVAERCIGCGDTSRFGLIWKPNLAKGKAVMRIFLVNGHSEIIAELHHSPLILNIDSKIAGNASLYRLNYNYGANNVCGREFRMIGKATNSETPGQEIDIVIIDEYRGKILAINKTDTSGNFNIYFNVSNSAGEETQFIVPRAYVYVDNDGDGIKDLVALQTLLFTNVGGYPALGNKFLSTVPNCNWSS